MLHFQVIHITKHARRYVCGVVLLFLAWMQALHVLPSTVVDRMDLFIYDMRMRLQLPALDPRIVIVDIDEKSLSAIGRWPWSRDVLAKFTDQLTQYYQVRAIGFDVVFAEKDNSSGYGVLDRLSQNEFKNNAQFAQTMQALKPQLDYDQRFAQAMQDQPIVLAYVFSMASTTQRTGMLPTPAFRLQDFPDAVINAQSYSAYSANLPILQQSAAAAGFVNPVVDSDGVIRRVALMARLGDGYYESMALALTRVALRAQHVRPQWFAADGLNSAEALKKSGVLQALYLDTPVRPTRVHVDELLSTLIQYRGVGGPQGGSFRYVSAADVLAGALPQADLANRIILVGTTAAGLKDLRSSPVGPDFPGVEIHANVIKSILDNAFKSRPDFSLAFDLLQISIFGVLLILGFAVCRPVASLLLVMMSLAALCGFNFWMYQQFSLDLPLATALLLVLALYLLNTVWGYLFEYRKGRAMEGLFGEYVSPELVAVMSENPENYNMEGETRELSVMFADVRDFTAISENLAPNVLREYINLYLTTMSQLIRQQMGTLDKYIGDAVMAFWGAPVALPDHAPRAIATALQMQKAIVQLNQHFEQKGWPLMRIGIGINTGEMRVGDMGSKIRRAYTVMGDAVNLASRLEGLCKLYGVGMIVGEQTMHAAPEFAFRELACVRVKGKQQPIKIYEPIALKSAMTLENEQALQLWHTALAHFYTREWDKAEKQIHLLLALDPKSALYAYYLKLIAQYKQQAPASDWDGVSNFDVK